METKISSEEKGRILEKLSAYCCKYPSRNTAAASLRGVSPATISAIFNNKWESISEEMWKNIAWQVDINPDGWNIHRTPAYEEMMFTFADSQMYRNVTWVVGDAGCGKTTAARQYREEHKEVYYVLCSEDMRKSDFVREMATQIGIPTDGFSLRDILHSIISTLSGRKEPLLIFDEGDKLTDTVFAYFITIYNRLEGRVGISFISTSYIQRRMRDGLRYNKKGYKEINSRIGRKFYELERTTANEVYAICKLNGISSDTEIKRIIKDAETCDYDLRRVKKIVHASKRITASGGK